MRVALIERWDMEGARRAVRSESDIEPPARPFLKWVGGKRQLLGAIEKHVPAKYRTYHEPFLGGAALFFHAKPTRAVLSDSNVRLIRTYRGIQNDVEGVIRRLRAYRYERAHYLRVRQRDIDKESDTDLAAWFIFLNRTGFNGLYRVNSKNRFNVPFGRYTNPLICDADNLRACAKALASAELRVDGFESVLRAARKGDFVYFDPPYVPLSPTSSFTSYTSAGFDEQMQTRLRDVVAELKERGVRVLLSNSAAPLVKLLYQDFEREEVAANRMVNSRADRRHKITELLIW
ncbi:MAG TPA: DNA adenine methylase [Polyangiaceae bacterium]|jgi:DNA adenine methylase